MCFIYVLSRKKKSSLQNVELVTVLKEKVSQELKFSTVRPFFLRNLAKIKNLLLAVELLFWICLWCRANLSANGVILLFFFYVNHKGSPFFFMLFPRSRGWSSAYWRAHFLCALACLWCPFGHLCSLSLKPCYTSRLLTRIAAVTGDTEEAWVPERAGVFNRGVFQQPALPGLGAADVRELSCNHSA